MLAPRWYKVFRDLWMNKLRTILIVLAIAIGVFTFGAVMTTREVTLAELTRSYLDTRPAHIVLTTSAFDEGVVKTVESMREVESAEGRRTYPVSLRIDDTTWIRLTLTAIEDFDDMQMSYILPENGDFPPQRREVVIERSLLNLPIYTPEDTITIETPQGDSYTLQMVGYVHNVILFPSQFFQEGYGYITFDTLEWLGGLRSYNEFHIMLHEAETQADVEQTAVDIRERIEREGVVAYTSSIPEPGKHWNTDGLLGLTLVLSVVGFFSVFLSAFLIINTITSVMKQQMRQVGMMKSIGGQSHQIMGIYLLQVGIFGVLAFLIALPLGALGARGLSQFMALMVNFDIDYFSVSPTIIIIQAFLAILLPLIIAIFPVLSGVSVSVREALSDFGIGQVEAMDGFIDRMIGHLRGIPRPLMISLRNTFRRKGRLALTLLTLTLAGSVFIAVFSVRDALFLEVGKVFTLLNFDLGVLLVEPEQIRRIEREALRVPGVASVQGWHFTEGQYIRDDGTEGVTMKVFVLPTDTPYSRPQIEGGRWLHEDDTNAIVVMGNMLYEEQHLSLGDTVIFKMQGQEHEWEIVGLLTQMEDPESDGFAYVNIDYYTRLYGLVGMSNYLVVQTDTDNLIAQYGIQRDLEEHFKQVGIGISQTLSVGQVTASGTAVLNTVIVMMLLIAMLLALVGGLGLMGTMSLNVIERTREIGVMRSVGASNRAIWEIVVVEGVLIGITSAVFGSILAMPMSQLLGDAVGLAMVKEPLDYAYSLLGVLIWFALSITLAAFASYIPARNAVKLSIRETLSYE